MSIRWLAKTCVACLLMAGCQDQVPTGSIASNEICYGDSVCATISYTETRDSTDWLVVVISAGLKNISGRVLSIDSTQRGTFLEVYDGNNALVWISPRSWSGDTATHRVTLQPDSTHAYTDVWGRIDFNSMPVPAGRYAIRGTILSKKTGDVVYSEL